MKKTIFNNLFVLFFALALLNVFAINAQQNEVQTKVISGTLVDDTGLPVTGTLLYNSLVEAITGKDGEFSIKVPLTKDDRIVINEEGYQLKTVNVVDGSIAEPNVILHKRSTIEV